MASHTIFVKTDFRAVSKQYMVFVMIDSKTRIAEFLSAVTPKTRMFVYVVASDTNLAPNVTGGHCTLAVCKPMIRRSARVGDLVVGMAPRKHGPARLVYAMRVAETLGFASFWCDMDRDGGGWTLITSINKKLNADTTSVDNNTLVKPGIDGNYTNRNMQLSPTPSEILTVQDGHDAGQETAYDRTEKWVGVTGAPINWGQIIADLNTNSYYATSFFKGLYLR